MIDIERLDRVHDIFVSMSINSNFMMKFFKKTYLNRDPTPEPIQTYNLKNLEEVQGVFIMISIDPSDPTLGYCYLEIGEEHFKIIIHDPKIVFKEWDEAEGIVFFEKVAILRLDEDEKTCFHLRYISKERQEINILQTEEIWKYIEYADPIKMQETIDSLHSNNKG